MIPLRACQMHIDSVPDYSRDMVASLELSGAAVLVAFALRGLDGYTRRDALSNRRRVLRYLDHLVEGLDEHGVRAVRNAMIGILPIADIERLIKEAQENAKPKGDEVFDGL